ncbi:MAG: PAS domain-containing protein, partial [Pseudomonadota bacterium]|nr:PAS domain-containing protein [Pseudomonadota bacterium]
RILDPLHLKNFKRLLAYKITELKHYDLVITADQPALQFALAHHQELFAGVPIVFCGINDIQTALDLEPNPQVTGIIETLSLTETLETALRLHPITTQVVAITDASIQGQKKSSLFWQAQPQFPQVKFIELSLTDLDFNELAEKLASLTHSIVILLSAYQDHQGHQLNFNKSLKLITQHTQMPIYHLWHQGIGEGIMGGKFVNYYQQGQKAAQLAIKILTKTTTADRLPIITQSLNQYEFDYQQLERFNIHLAQLPPNSMIINQPSSLYSEYKQTFWLTIAVVLLLTLLTLFLYRSNRKLKQENKRRTQAEAALRQSEERFYLAISGANDGLWDWDLIADSVWCSPQFFELLDYRHNEFTPSFNSITALLHPEDKNILFSAVEAHLKQETAYDIEVRFLTQKQNYRWFRVSGQALWNEAHEAVRMAGSITDISQRKQAELLLHQYNQTLEQEVVARTQAFAESEQRFDLAMQGSNDGLFDWNIAANTLYFSPCWKAMLGYADHEIPHEFNEWQKRLHPDDVARALKNVDDFLTQNIPTYEVNFRMQHKQGHYVWILARAVGLWDQHGKPQRLVGTHMDLTPIKTAEIELLEAKAALEEVNSELTTTSDQLKLILENLPIVPFTCVAGGNFAATYIGTSVKKVTGYEPEQFTTDTDFWADHLHPDDKTSVLDNIALLFEHDHYVHEYRWQIADGSYKWFLTALQLVRTSTGEPSHAVGAWLDISERKQSELELNEAKQAAEVANQSKSAFLANMSHELRTPLNAILGYAQLLSRYKELSQSQQEGLQIIHRSGEHLLTLINDILDISKIEANKFDLVAEHFYLNAFLHDLAEPMKMRANQKGLTFIHDSLVDDTVVVYADEKRLRQVLLNLLSNAIKFTQHGSIHLQIKPEDAENICFSVTDTGIGLPAEKIEEVFLPFKQIGRYSRQIEGTGLGLSISQRLVQMMGGELQVESTFGQGSRFWFTIPLPRSVQKFEKRSKVQQPLILGLKEGPRKVLIVDDHYENRAFLNNLLTPLGFITLEAHNGQEALTLAQQQLPDVIIVDLVMPVVDGFEFVRRLRRIEALESTIIIATSASVLEYSQEGSMEAGCNSFIPKPIDTDALLALLQQQLQLSWVYEQQEEIEQSDAVSLHEVITHGPTAKQAEQLFDLVTMGNLRKAVRQIEKLQEHDAQLTAFAEEMKRLAKSYEVAKLEYLIKKYINK